LECNKGGFKIIKNKNTKAKENNKIKSVTVSKLNNDETFLINPPPSFC
jgi:hypothetical protein